MSRPAEALHSDPASGERSAVQAGSAVRLVRAADGQDTGGPGRSQAASPVGAAVQDQPSAGSNHGRTSRSWPVLVLALPATVAVWSGWVGIGQMTGFGQVHPLPGIWGSFHLDTAVTLPVGVEAYAAYALRAWLSSSSTLSSRTAGSPAGPRSALSCWAWPGRSPTTSSPRPGSRTRRGASPPRCPGCPSWSLAWAPPSRTCSAQTRKARTRWTRLSPPTRTRRRTTRTTAGPAGTTVSELSSLSGWPRQRVSPRCSAPLAGASPGAPCARLVYAARTQTWVHWRASSGPSRLAGLHRATLVIPEAQ
jgi:hypothetical protein